MHGRREVWTRHETYRQRHLRLHEALNELLAEYAQHLRLRGQCGPLEAEQAQQFLESLSTAELLEWSYEQTQALTAPNDPTR
jgi:hypothetical protein